MKAFSLIAALVATATVTLADAPQVPSGHTLHLQETRLDALADGRQMLRLRYVMPALAEASVGFDAIAGDFQVLCDAQALIYLKENGAKADQIVVSLSAEETEFGVADPAVVQYFELFTIGDDTCIWEAF